jgi:sulfoacetaldehyde dehydrogenase
LAALHSQPAGRLATDEGWNDMAAARPIADTPEAREVAELIARSRAAQQQIANYTQEQVDRLIRGMVYAVARDGVAEEIAQHTVDESQQGN